MKYSKDGKVCFHADNHTYRLGDAYLQGVTGLIEKFKNPFDSDAVAAKYAAKHGLNKDHLLIEWAEKGKKSRDDGTAVHQMIEQYILTGHLPTLSDRPKETAAIKFIEKYFESGTLIPVKTELIVHNERIATQLDCVVRNKDGEYFYLDWKTNSKISDNGYGKRMLRPFHHYPDASFYHYSLQLNIGKILCTDYPIKDAFIVHLMDNDFSIINIEPMEIPQHVLLNQPHHEIY